MFQLCPCTFPSFTLTLHRIVQPIAPWGILLNNARDKGLLRSATIELCYASLQKNKYLLLRMIFFRSHAPLKAISPRKSTWVPVETKTAWLIRVLPCPATWIAVLPPSLHPKTANGVKLRVCKMFGGIGGCLWGSPCQKIFGSSCLFIGCIRFAPPSVSDSIGHPSCTGWPLVADLAADWCHSLADQCKQWWQSSGRRRAKQSQESPFCNNLKCW